MTKSFYFGGCCSWKATCVAGRFMVGLLGDQKPSLPSSLLPWGECVSCSSVPPGLRVHVRAVRECFRSHSANHTRSGEMRSGSWFLEEWTAAKPQTNATARQLNIQAALIISSSLTSSLSSCEAPLGAELQTCSLVLFYFSTSVM